MRPQADPRPCKGDAWQPCGTIVKDALGFYPAKTRPKDGCAGCARAESNGGKCAGENCWYFMLCAVAVVLP